MLRCSVIDMQVAITITLPYNAVFGMGERFDGVNQKGRTVVNEVVEKFCYQGNLTYCPAPFFFTDSGLGLYLDTAGSTTFEFGDSIAVTCPADCDIVLFCGTPSQIISEYTALFGKAKLPPKWAFGPWISANRWSTQQQVEQQLATLAEHDFPATVLVVEAWSDEATFYVFNGAQYRPVPDGKALQYEDFDFSHSRHWQDPKGMVDKLHSNGLHLVLWQIPVYKKQGDDEQFCQQNALDRADAIRRGLTVNIADGTPYTIPQGNWFAGSMIPDFTNALARESWFAKRQYLLDIGVDGFKTDGGEFIYSQDIVFSNGTRSQACKNLYAQSYTSAYSSFIGDSNVLFSRAGFSGQHTTPMHWGGDQQSTNDELCNVLGAGLSAALTGIPFWGFDIAGFAGPLPTLDLYRRATQLACFVPVMQWHSEPDGGQFKELMPGGEGNNERSPWNMAEVYSSPGFANEMRYWHRLRMNLLPYLYSTALDCTAQGTPMMRPLVYNWHDDADAVAVEDEFMLGDSLLVAPLLQENTMDRSLYLPQGQWYSLFSHTCYSGRRSIRFVEEGRLPVFIADGKGLALNLDDTHSLGSAVGNAVDCYQCLHLLLAGQCGSYHFADDLGNNFTVHWQSGRIELDGIAVTPFTHELIV